MAVLDASGRAVAVVSAATGERDLDRRRPERRRRPSLRIVHLSRPRRGRDRDRRPSAGFDDAAPDTIDLDELRGAADAPRRARPTRAAADHRRSPTASSWIPVAHELRRDGRARPPPTQGVRAARDAGRPSGPGLHPPPAARSGLGHRPRRRPADGRRPRPLAALQDRAAIPSARSTSITVRGVGYRLDPEADRTVNATRLTPSNNTDR